MRKTRHSLAEKMVQGYRAASRQSREPQLAWGSCSELTTGATWPSAPGEDVAHRPLLHAGRHPGGGVCHMLSFRLRASSHHPLQPLSGSSILYAVPPPWALPGLSCLSSHAHRVPWTSPSPCPPPPTTSPPAPPPLLLAFLPGPPLRTSPLPSLLLVLLTASSPASSSPPTPTLPW